jgi:hypothetical protein
VISDEVNGDYSEWFLGHNSRVYYTESEKSDLSNKVYEVSYILRLYRVGNQGQKY